MKFVTPLVIATLLLGCLAGQTAEAREYVVKNIGMKGLASSCGRGGGEFVETEGGYHCNYQNGNIRECSKSTKKCVVVTPLTVAGTGEDENDQLGQFTSAQTADFN